MKQKLSDSIERQEYTAVLSCSFAFQHHQFHRICVCEYVFSPLSCSFFNSFYVCIWLCKVKSRSLLPASYVQQFVWLQSRVFFSFASLHCYLNFADKFHNMTRRPTNGQYDVIFHLICKHTVINELYGKHHEAHKFTL